MKSINRKQIGKHADRSIKRNNLCFIQCELNDILNTYDNIILLDNLTDQRNIGAIIRSAAICNFAVLLREKSTINEITLKCASGGTEYTKIHTIKNLQETVNKIKKSGFWFIGLNEKGDINVDLSFEKKVIVIGSEGNGISQLLQKNCDLFWRLSGGNEEFNIFNASNASAIAMYICSQK